MRWEERETLFPTCQCSVTAVAHHSKEGKRGLDYHENVYIFGAKHGVEAKGNGANNLIKSHTEPKNRFIERINYEKTYGIELFSIVLRVNVCYDV